MKKMLYMPKGRISYMTLEAGQLISSLWGLRRHRTLEAFWIRLYRSSQLIESAFVLLCLSFSVCFCTTHCAIIWRGFDIVGWSYFGWGSFLQGEPGLCFWVLFWVCYFLATPAQTWACNVEWYPILCLCWRKRGTSFWGVSFPFMTWWRSKVCLSPSTLLKVNAPGKTCNWLLCVWGKKQLLHCSESFFMQRSIDTFSNQIQFPNFPLDANYDLCNRRDQQGGEASSKHHSRIQDLWLMQHSASGVEGCHGANGGWEELRGWRKDSEE